MAALVREGKSERWKAALGLAGYGALRLGEGRGLRWSDVSFTENMISVSRSLLPDGQAKVTKSEAGMQTVASSLNLNVCKGPGRSRAPTKPEDLIVCAAEACPSWSATYAERSTRRRPPQG